MNGLAAAVGSPPPAPLGSLGLGSSEPTPAAPGAQSLDFAALLKPAIGTAAGDPALAPALPGPVPEAGAVPAPTASVRKGPGAPSPDAAPLKDLFLDCPAPPLDPATTALAACAPFAPEPALEPELAAAIGGPGPDGLGLFAPPSVPAQPQTPASESVAAGFEPFARREPLATLALSPAAPEAAITPPATEPLLPELSASGAGLVPVPAFSLGPPAAAAITTPAPPLPPASPPPPLDTRFNDWPEQLGERIRWQLRDGVQEARIELAPAGLGALELRVQVEAGQVQLHIGAAQAATRDLLSEALPRLRELLGDSGLSLGQTSVFDQQERTPSRPAPGGPGRALSASADEEAGAGWTPVRARRGLFDHYA